MPTTHFAISSDLPGWAKVLALLLAAVSFVLLVVEMRRRERGAVAIVATGLFALAALLLAILRPVRIAARESSVGPRVVVLADTSRSMALPSDGSETRAATRDRALAAVTQAAREARLGLFGFADGEPTPLPDPAASPEARAPRGAASDLGEALRALSKSAEERPAAVVVISDGRLDDPAEGASDAALAGLVSTLKIPVHTIATTRDAKPDASVRHVATSGAAVAHVPFPLRIEIGCGGGLSCDELAVTARELRDDGPPSLLASGMAHVKDGKGALDLTVTLDRAGPRIVEVAVASPQGDAIPENDRRFLTFNVTRERVRVLHVAGRPTNDVRALRQWLKSDASVDVVAFFILRTTTDNTQTRSPDELALIPFPVDELFSDHLPSFDAVVLQDFDAQPYGLERHLPALARYVRAGGGLIMVGGEKSFVAGGYAGTPLAAVLPITLDDGPGATQADPSSFVPVWTNQGSAAPLLAPLRGVVGDELPTMAGANVLGDVLPGGVVLWTHPTRTTKSGAKMPVLAIGDMGDGRSIAFGADGGWLLEFSQLGARTAGRGHGALWDGLLGWLMRDPRFEPAQLEVLGGCTAGLPSTVRVRLLPAAKNAAPETVSLDVARLDRHTTPVHLEAPRPAAPTDVVELKLPPLEAGGYTARLRLGRGQATRRDFACEVGGDEWADSRPDADRLKTIAKALGGKFFYATDDLRALPLPKPTVISAERHVMPVAPPWAWTLLAAAALGAHWIVRRRSGLS